jgi:hypothetical protein
VHEHVVVRVDIGGELVVVVGEDEEQDDECCRHRRQYRRKGRQLDLRLALHDVLFAAVRLAGAPVEPLGHIAAGMLGERDGRGVAYRTPGAGLSLDVWVSTQLVMKENG